MEKTIYVKGHYRNGKYISGYHYVRTFKEPNFNGRVRKSYVEDTKRKIIALKKYSDFQSPEYQVALDYLEKNCPEVAFLIGNSGKKLSSLKLTKELYDKVNYAYDILYTK